jgi:hypothetical protein
MAPEFDHLASALDDATAPIYQQLRDRLETAPSEKDWLAISTAIAKGIAEGLRRGAGELSAQVEEALPAEREVHWELDLDCIDLWAERYGRSEAA